MKRIMIGLALAALAFAAVAPVFGAVAPSRKTLYHTFSLSAVAGKSDSLRSAIDGGVPDTLKAFKPAEVFDIAELTNGAANTTAQVIGRLNLNTALANGGTAADSIYFAFDTSEDGVNWTVDDSMEGMNIEATDRFFSFPLFADLDAATNGVGGWVLATWVRVRILTDGDHPSCGGVIVAPQ